MMRLKDISFDSPQENILFDEVLLKLAEDGQAGEVLRFWESGQDFVVLGRIGKLEEDAKMENARRDNILVLRRSSGGGTVVQGPGCLNYSLVLSKLRNPSITDLRKSYQLILGKIIDALAQLGCDAKFCPVSDIALAENDRKISGNAQKRSKNFILHHGTILYDFDLGKMERYLKIPKDMPDYRRQRAHSDFVSNVALTKSEIQSSIKKVFKVQHEVNRLGDDEKKRLEQFCHDREVNVDLSGVT